MSKMPAFMKAKSKGPKMSGMAATGAMPTGGVGAGKGMAPPFPKAKGAKMPKLGKK